MKPLCPDCGDRHEKYQAHIWPVSNASPVSNAVSNAPNKSVDYLRVKMWREANRARYNEKQRELMKLRRAKKSASPV
jgi:hypothetical protein